MMCVAQCAAAALYRAMLTACAQFKQWWAKAPEELRQDKSIALQQHIQAFRRYDTDNNGEISLESFTNLVKDLEGGGKRCRVCGEERSCVLDAPRSLQGAHRPAAGRRGGR